MFKIVIYRHKKSPLKKESCMLIFQLVPQAGLEPARQKRHRILSPACLPVPPPGQAWSEKRDSNPRPQPWQGCALPAELFSQTVRMKGLEPPRLSAPDPKSGVATNYTTSACFCFTEFLMIFSRFQWCKDRINSFTAKLFSRKN